MCELGRARLGVPAESAGRVIEYRLVGPLPLGRSPAVSVGLHEGAVVLSVGLDLEREARFPRVVRGVLLHGGRAAVPWALEVTAVQTFVRPEAASAGRGSTAKLPAWARRMIDPRDGAALAWIDVPRLLSSLEAEGGAAS